MPEPQNLQARLKQSGQDFQDGAEQLGNDISSALSSPLATSPNITVNPIGAALSGPVADVKGAVNDISAALANPTAFAENAISSALASSPVGGLLGGLLGGGGFSSGLQKNPLNKFASYNYVFTFGAITKDSFNAPDSSA